MKHIKEFDKFLNESKLRKGKSYHGSKIFVFDMDDTLILTSAKIKVYNHKTKERFELTPKEYNDYEKHPDHYLDFADFGSYEIMKGAKLIDYYLKIFKDAYKHKIAIGIVTAREDYNMIYRWFKEHLGYVIDKDLIFAVNDKKHGLKGNNNAEKKKEAFKKFIEMGYTDMQFFDDDKENLRLVKSLEKEYPHINITTIHAKI